MRQNQDRTWLVAVAASLWGLSALWRSPLTQHYPPLAIVFWEHLLLVLLAAPWLLTACRHLLRATRGTQLAVLVIGSGSSATATLLFTAAFRVGDPVTPQVLQKAQPVMAILLGALLLGERLRPRFVTFVIPALVGTWMLTFPDPLGATVESSQAALLALCAALLWAAGTVLGRLASTELGFKDLVALRFTIGLITLATLAAMSGTPISLSWSAAPSIVLLAVIPGLLALVLYYLALSRTPAARAALAELAFPLTAAIIGVTVLDARLSASQWIGAVILVVAVVSMMLHELRSRQPAVEGRPRPVHGQVSLR